MYHTDLAKMLPDVVKCHGRFLRAGASSPERTSITVFCIVCNFASTVLLAQFPLCRMLAAIFHCITAGPYGGGSLGSYEPPSSTCSKLKSEPNHCVVVRDLIEGSEVEPSLKRLEVPSYALYAPHCPPFCYDVIG